MKGLFIERQNDRGTDNGFYMATDDEVLRNISPSAQQQIEIEVLNKASKEIATSFFYWWHNQPGANTQQGFSEWWVSPEARRIVDEIINSNNGEG